MLKVNPLKSELNVTFIFDCVSAFLLVETFDSKLAKALSMKRTFPVKSVSPVTNLDQPPSINWSIVALANMPFRSSSIKVCSLVISS